MKKILFEILGDPVAQGRPRAGKTFTGKTVLYDPAKSRNFKEYVRMVAAQHAPKKLIEGPIHLNMDFYRSPPKKYQTKPKMALIESGQLLPTSKPDLDNLAKGVKDGLSKIIWQDDSQVVSMNVRKFYSMTPKVVVHISYFEEG
ncbi:RusA family crossover junction endodeoxyribonuclease [Planococcus shenhongbingii]|uniref:RusA family crossover junction endodeoxyribonuclease n=1 Tax=Planococcus shenhongbingii TaxID=3058398 RepID=UPI0026227B71|nr:RusA family crossover junction endodeoxyribonuclease [Planococcus sp. N016]WKA57155.1 RusA family crossover junction endodeoxyribonuclease [Planococcus sp. N016]